MIFLTKIILINFKIFGGEPYSINFEGNKLVLLDGPNGYGKTSVFDAVELALTGNISRLITLENRQNPADIVVAHKNASSVEILLEFKDESSNTRLFQRKLKSNISGAAKRIARFAELWELNEIIDGKAEPVKANVLENFFDSKNFARDFLLFHYVQQEETSRFLKTNNETQRATELAQLFGDTREADDNLEKLTTAHKKINAAKKTTTNRISELQRLYHLNPEVAITAEPTEAHQYAFPWLSDSNISPYWDLETIPELTEQRFSASLAEIEAIKWLVSHSDFYLRNRHYQSALHQRNLLELYVGYANTHLNYQNHQEFSKTYQEVKNSYNILQQEDISDILKNSRLENLYAALKLPGRDEFRDALTSLNTTVSTNKGISSVYAEILKLHSKLSPSLDATPNETSCFFCGHDHDTHYALKAAVTKHGDLLRIELSDKDRITVTARENFSKHYLANLLNACKVYLESNAEAGHTDLNKLAEAFASKDRLENIRQWLVRENIEHEDLLAKEFPVTARDRYIAEATDVLCERIRALIGPAPDNFYETHTPTTLDRIFKDYFNKTSESLSSYPLDLLTQKETYIKEQYGNDMRAHAVELQKLQKNGALYERALSDIGDLITTVRSQIRKYRKDLITDIEIPFYIYSGKILQSHQAGIGHGIFIKDPTGEDELKNVRLVSDWKSDHDILNTMSSGQISAVVIALTLALHRVYSKKFGTILIDDPVQTMDDINMSSLVELLRNDFQDKQIVLSTHEDKVARYFTYKYIKHSESVKIVNLMQRREYVPSNRFKYSTDS